MDTFHKNSMTFYGWNDLYATVNIIIENSELQIFVSENNIEIANLNCLNSSSKNFSHPLQQGLHSKGASNSIKKFYNSLCTLLFPYIKNEKDSQLDYKHYSKEHKRIKDLFSSTQKEFLNNLDQKIVVQARKFSNCRWSYYKYLKQFNHLRIDQLLISCPALISILCISLKDEILTKENHDQFIKYIKDGVPLKEILNHLFDYLLNSNYEYWIDFRNFSLSRKEQARSNWIWTVLNAPPSTGANYLIFPPPFYICKSDFPKNKLDQANWIKRTKMFAMMVIPEKYSGISLNQIKGLILMISKSGNKSFNYIDKKRGGLCKFLAETNKKPNSKNNYKTFFNDVHKYHKKESLELEQKAKLIKDEAKNQIIKNDGRIHNHDLFFENELISIRALTSIKDLKQESTTMNNCVKDQWYEAFLKRYIHFHVEIQSSKYSLSIDPNTKDIVDFKGIKNAGATSEHTDILINAYFKNKSKFEEFFSSNSMVEKPEDYITPNPLFRFT